MRCSECENVIVTVRNQPGARELDMELPAFLPVAELTQHFLETMQEFDPAHFMGMTAVTFQTTGGQELSGEQTLAGVGIWDGAILDAHLHEGV